GPPRDCATVAIVTPALTLLRVEASDEDCRAQSYATETLRQSGSIDIHFTIQTSKDVTSFSESVGRMLREELGLQTSVLTMQHQNTGEVILTVLASTVGLRDSTILNGGWREALDFGVTLAKTSGGTISVSGTPGPMVCRQATGQIIDYHGLDGAQTTSYASVLTKDLKHALTRVCSRFTEVNDTTL